MKISDFIIKCKHCNSITVPQLHVMDGSIGLIGGILLDCANCNAQGFVEIDAETMYEYACNPNKRITKNLTILILDAASKSEVL